MISDRFVLPTPVEVEKRHVSISGRDESLERIEHSTDSFISGSLNNENFGDWGSFNNSKTASFANQDDNKIDDPFKTKEEKANMGSGFNLIDRSKSVPKLPVSKREIRKVTASNHEHSQPIIVIETGPPDEGVPISPIAFGSPVANSMSNYSRIRAEPTRILKRSVSDTGSNFSNSDILDDPQETKNPPSPSFRSMFSAQKGSEMSLSFSQRRKPFENRALLLLKFCGFCLIILVSLLSATIYCCLSFCNSAMFT